jgi:hypothetical protein
MRMNIIKERHADYHKSPAEGQCHCGCIVVLDNPLDNLCECGLCYNMSGQRVTPSWECDDQGNPFEDDQ